MHVLFLIYSSTCAFIVGGLEKVDFVLVTMSVSKGLSMFFKHLLKHVLECLLLGLFGPLKLVQLLATDLLALPSMKNAAKCDK